MLTNISATLQQVVDLKQLTCRLRRDNNMRAMLKWLYFVFGYRFQRRTDFCRYVMLKCVADNSSSNKNWPNRTSENWSSDILLETGFTCCLMFAVPWSIAPWVRQISPRNLRFNLSATLEDIKRASGGFERSVR